MNSVIEVNNISVKYGDFIALKNFNLEINQGEFIALLGSNGAGKSTFINSLAGFQKLFQGSIVYNDAYLREGTPFSTIGFSPQTQVMDWYTTVWDNVMIGLKLSGKNKREANELCSKALKLVSLFNERNKIVDSLSGGQQQRVQIARAIAHNPSIYILDEPTTGLDAESSEELLQFLKDETKNGKIVIMSSHDINLLEKYSDKILFIKKGFIEYYGNIGDFINKDDANDSSKYRIIVESNLKDKFKKERIENLEGFNVEVISDTELCVEVFDQSRITDFLGFLSEYSVINDIYKENVNLRDKYLYKVE